MTATVILPQKQLRLPVLNETHTHSNILRPRLNQLKLQLFNKIQQIRHNTFSKYITGMPCIGHSVLFTYLGKDLNFPHTRYHKYTEKSHQC